MPDSIELGPFLCVRFCFDFVACLEKKSSINAIFIYIFRLKKEKKYQISDQINSGHKYFAIFGAPEMCGIAQIMILK